MIIIPGFNYVVTGTGVGGLDTLLSQPFDSAALGDFTQTGLALVSSPFIQGSKTARLIHQAGSPQSFKQVKAVDPKYREKNLTLSLFVRSSATSGNLVLNIYDETNAANLIASQAITLGSFSFSATTNSNTTLSGISSSDINKLKVGETITGSGIPTGTLITAINISALTATISQAATASATVTLKNSDLPQKQSASFDVPNNCASISYTISALAESGLPETYIDDVVIQLTSAALTSTSVSIQTKNSEVVGTGYSEAVGTIALSSTIPFDNTIPQITEGTQFLTLTYTPKRVGNKLRILAQAYISEDSNTGATVTMAVFKDGASNAVAVASAPYDDANTSIDQGMLVTTKEFTVTSLNAVTFTVRGGGDVGSSTLNNWTRDGGTDATFGGIGVSSIQVEEIQVGDYSEATTIPLTSAVFATQPDSQMTWFTMTGYASTRTRVPYFSAPRNMVGSAISWTSSAINGLEVTVQESGYYDIHWEINTVGGGDSSYYAIGLNTTDFTTAFTSLRSDFLDYKYRNGANHSDTVHLAYSGPLNAGDKVYPLGNSSTSYITLANTSFAVSKVGSTKQINISSDQKIDLPTSELIMGPNAGVGSTNNRTIYFTGVSKLVGDAFTVSNDNVNGFALTLKKSGILYINAGINVATSAYISLSKNATQFNVDPQSMTAGQNVSANYAGNNENDILIFSGKVNTGDIFRCHVFNGIGPSGFAAAQGAGFQAFFQEDKVQVSLSNVLPQFTQSDNAVRVNTGTSFGTTYTSVRRFTSIIDNIGTSVTYADSPSLGASFTINEDGLYSISYTEQATTSNFGIGKNMTAYAQTQDMIAWATANSSIGVDFATASCQVYLVKGDVIRPLAGSPGNHNNTVNVKFHISKVGKPNLTSVDVTPFTNYKGTDTEFISLYASPGNGSTASKIRRFSTTLKNTNLGIIRYTDDAINGGSFTALKKCTVNVSYSDFTSSNGSLFGISKNASSLITNYGSLSADQLTNIANNNVGTLSDQAHVSTTLQLEVGDVLRAHHDGNFTVTGDQRTRFNLVAVAEADQIVSPISSFSSDTASLVYAPSTSYTLSTLKDAPVGTFITFTYDTANNIVSRPQTTTAPTQTVSDMNVNGIRLFIRDYNSTSTAASPCAIAIQVGKGFKGHTVDIYKSTGKVTGGSYDMFYDTASVYGAFRSYDETSGILYLDAGRRSANGGVFVFNDNTTQTNGYVVINASKSPSLAAVPQLQPRIAVLRDEKASGTQGGTFTSGAWQTRTLNTIEDSSGIVTSLVSNQFILSAGEYFIEAIAPADAVENHKCKIRNITDSTDAIIGTSGDTTAGTGFITHSFCSGRLILNTAKTFELQHRCNSTLATSGFGEASSYGVNEVYSVVKIQKIK